MYHKVPDIVKMSVHQSKIRILLGQVIGTKMKKTAKVRVERLVLDKYLMQYYPRRSTVFAHDAQEAAKEGDIVLVKQLPLRRSKHVKYMMERIVYSQGNVTDPITGTKCDGFSYWDSTASSSEDRDGQESELEDTVSGLSSDGHHIGRDIEMERESEGTPV